jgi:hypothetical protein
MYSWPFIVASGLLECDAVPAEFFISCDITKEHGTFFLLVPHNPEDGRH